MKAGASMLCLLWFAGATFAGYRLTERSFAWVDQPNFGLPQTAPSALKIPSQFLDVTKRLTPKQLSCLRASVSPAHFQAALQGHLTAEESAAVAACFK